jgi:acyl carrier protein
MWTDTEVQEALNIILIDVLGVEAEDLTPDARFFEDLDGESIDVLELSFRCEKHFKTKIEFQRMLGGELPATDSAGGLTDEAIEAIREKLPFINADEIRKHRKAHDLRQLMTVNNISQYLLHVLRAADAQCADKARLPRDARIAGA